MFMYSSNSWMKTLLLFLNPLKMSGFFPTSPQFLLARAGCAPTVGCYSGGPLSPLPLPPSLPLLLLPLPSPLLI